MNDLTSTAPGIGVAGMVLCPYFKSPCMKSGCEMWVEFFYKEGKVARCSLAWQPVILSEVRLEIEKFRKGNKE